jgi:hypothetical protein
MLEVVASDEVVAVEAGELGSRDASMGALTCLTGSDLSALWDTGKLCEVASTSGLSAVEFEARRDLVPVGCTERR